MTTEQFIELLKAIGFFAWPAVILYLLGFRFYRLIRARLERGNFKIKAGPLELDLSDITEVLPVVETITGTSNVRWERTGNLWWFCSDSLHAISRLLGGATKAINVHDLRQVHHHASELALDTTILEVLRRLRDESINSSDDAWTSAKREEVAYNLQVVINSVAKLATDNQKDFRPDPA